MGLIEALIGIWPVGENRAIKAEESPSLDLQNHQFDKFSRCPDSISDIQLIKFSKEKIRFILFASAYSYIRYIVFIISKKQIKSPLSSLIGFDAIFNNFYLPVGCMRDVRLNGRYMPLDSQPHDEVSQVSIQGLSLGCSSDSCKRNQCSPPFTCVDLWRVHECRYRLKLHSHSI